MRQVQLHPGRPTLQLGELQVAEFDRTLTLTRQGWVADATPVSGLPELATELGLGSLTLKRDDLCRPTSGGNKVRKLDMLLPTLTDADTWTSAGAIGSGHVLCCAEAAQILGKRFVAHVFWEPLCPSVVRNLAVTASLSTEIIYHRSRLSMGVTAPRVLLAGVGQGVIPVGGTTVAGTIGMVRAGLELAAQVALGQLPAPDWLVVASGTGGSAAGLALGVQLGGLATRVIAVATVERLFSPTWSLNRLVSRVGHRLAAAGLPTDVGAARPQILRQWLGKGYGDPSAESIAACERATQHGVLLEPVYTGKAMAALLTLAPQMQGQHVLFWKTAHGQTPEPTPQWRERLPRRLRKRLHQAEHPTDPRRRQLMVSAGLAALGLAGGYRVLGYNGTDDWDGAVLTPMEAGIVMALAEGLLPPAAAAHLKTIAMGVDRYLAALPPKLRRLCRAALMAVEHTTPMGGFVQRTSRLPPADRVRVVQALQQRGGPLAEAARGARDLVMVGWYQLPVSWRAVGYAGPLVPKAKRPRAARYAAMVAPPGKLPKMGRQFASPSSPTPNSPTRGAASP